MLFPHLAVATGSELNEYAMQHSVRQFMYFFYTPFVEYAMHNVSTKIVSSHVNVEKRFTLYVYCYIVHYISAKKVKFEALSCNPTKAT